MPTEENEPRRESGDRHPADRLPRTLGAFDATMLVVSSVIGVGIFLVPGRVAALLPHPGLFLAAWLVGGALSLAGALANAELGAAFPHAGGDYVYLREAFHPLAGFLVGWLSFFAIYAGTVATLATGFADALADLVPLGDGGRLGIAATVILAASAVNWLGLRAGAAFNSATAALKIATILGLVVAGFALAPADAPHPAAAGFAGRWPAATDRPGLPAALGLALSPILFSYLGWNASVYVASELRDPSRTLPRSLFAGLGACTALYLAVNAVYLRVLGIEALAAAPAAGEAVARAILGEAGGTIASLLILLSVLGCLNATILVGPRIPYAMALDGLFFRGVAGVHAANRTPHVAIALQAATALGLVAVLRRFPSVLDYTTFAIVLATMADTAALYALRRRQPDRPRPYRARGYPVVPALYLAANAGIAAAMLAGRPLECAIGLAVAATGVPFYLVFAARARTRAA